MADSKRRVEQRAPVTDRAVEVLDEIDRERRVGRIVANVNGLIFTRDDGRAITKDMITAAIKTARRRTKVNDFRFTTYAIRLKLAGHVKACMSI